MMDEGVAHGMWIVSGLVTAGEICMTEVMMDGDETLHLKTGSAMIGTISTNRAAVQDGHEPF